MITTSTMSYLFLGNMVLQSENSHVGRVATTMILLLWAHLLTEKNVDHSKVDKNFDHTLKCDIKEIICEHWNSFYERCNFRTVLIFEFCINIWSKIVTSQKVPVEIIEWL